MFALGFVFLFCALVVGPAQGNPSNLEVCKSMLKPQTPKAARKAFSLEKHGHQRQDHYYWMRERDSAQVLKAIEAENTYFEQAFNKTTKALQEELFSELKSLEAEKSFSTPQKVGSYWYYALSLKQQDYPQYFRIPHSEGSTPQTPFLLDDKGDSLHQKLGSLVLDANALAKESEFFELGSLSPSPCGRYLAYSVDTTGRRLYRVFVKDLIHNTVKALGSVTNSNGSLVWGENVASHFLYTLTQDPKTLRSNTLLRVDPLKDVSEVLYFEKKEQFSLGMGKDSSRKYIFLHSHQSESSEVRFLNANEPLAELNLFAPAKPGVIYNIASAGAHNGFYVLTNEDSANFKIMFAPKETAKDPKSWRTIVPHDPNVYVSYLNSTRDFLLFKTRTKGIEDLTVLDIKNPDKTFAIRDRHADNADNKGVRNNPSPNAAVPAQFYSAGVLDFNANIIKYGTSTFNDVPEVWETRILDALFSNQASPLDKRLVNKLQLGRDHTAKNYVTRRLHVEARDGTKVPVSLIYKQGTALKDAPTLLYAYGSYGISIDPDFDFYNLPLLDRGFVYAIAHVRGGSFLGRPWYENGKMLNKKNTFYDFIDVAQYIKAHITQGGALFGSGRSAGGLLMGAVANMAPVGLFKALYAGVPFVDALTTMLDDSIPLTTLEYEEWGNPNEKEFYDYILSYSPLDNVHARRYPDVFAETGFHDSQVQYWEPLKWVSKLRHVALGPKRFLLHTEMHAGHDGGSGRTNALRTQARMLSYFINLER